MIDEKIIADADREIAEALKPEGGQFGVGARPAPVFRPHVATVTQPEPPAETPPPPLRTVSERLAELHAKLDLIDTKLDLLLAVIR